MVPCPTQVHFPNGISIGTAVFVQLTAEDGRPFPSTFPFRMGDLQNGSLRTPESTTRMTSRSVQPFLHGS